MRMKIKNFFILLLVFLNTQLWAETTWYSEDAQHKPRLNVSLFLSSTCTHCQKADAFFHELEAKTPWIHVERHVINEDKNALTQFYSMLNEQKMSDFAVPSAFFCNSRWVGFVDAQSTGKDILKGLSYCKQQIEKQKKLTPSTVSVLKHWANANLFDSSMEEQPKTFTYVVMMAFLDAFNPCALFGLLAFFGLLFVQDKQRWKLITGVLFVTAIGAAHYFQQVYAIAFFEWLPWLRWPTALIGLIIFYLAYSEYHKNKIHHQMMVITFFFAWVVWLYQQTCIMNWSYIFQQWLSNQPFTTTQASLVQLSYQALYLLPPIVTLIIYLLLSRTERLIKLKPLLHSVGTAYLISISLFLIIYPLGLASFSLSIIVLILVAVLGWLLKLSKIR